MLHDQIARILTFAIAIGDSYLALLCRMADAGDERYAARLSRTVEASHLLTRLRHGNDATLHEEIEHYAYWISIRST